MKCIQNSSFDFSLTKSKIGTDKVLRSVSGYRNSNSKKIFKKKSSTKGNDQIVDDYSWSKQSTFDSRRKYFHAL